MELIGSIGLSGECIVISDCPDTASIKISLVDVAATAVIGKHEKIRQTVQAKANNLFFIITPFNN